MSKKCEICGREVAERDPFYLCEVCGQGHCEHCGDSWNGDDEEDADFAGMYLEVVCDHCLNEGFVPPESAKCSASAYDLATRMMIVEHLCHAADQTQHACLMQVANAIMDTMSRRKKPQRRQWSRDTDHLEGILSELRALPEDEPNGESCHLRGKETQPEK